MKKYQILIEDIKKQFPVIKDEIFEISEEGTMNKVFLSKQFVIRLNDENSDILSREAVILKQIKHPLIPRILWVGKLKNRVAMIENRLTGKNINTQWKTLSDKNKTNIINQIVDFLKNLRLQDREHFYSVKTGKTYPTFLSCLTDDIEQKIKKIKKNKQANNLLNELLEIIEQPELKKIFIKTKKINLIHGDLIIHNLLTNGEELTGVVDWEFSLFGDADYDICRLFYYQETAKAYHEKGIDHTFEADFLDKLVKAIVKSDLIKDRSLFQNKYYYIRALFYLNALYWTVDSDDFKNNFDDLLDQWKKRGLDIKSYLAPNLSS